MSLQFLFLAVIVCTNSLGQTREIKKTTAELISEIYTFGEIDGGLFLNKRHSSDCIFVIVNEVIESDSSKVLFSTDEYDIGGLKVIYYPRKSIAGYNINYWFQVDEVLIGQKDALIRFKTIYSRDNWLEEYDQVHLDGQVEFRLEDGTWVIKGRKMREYKIER